MIRGQELDVEIPGYYCADCFVDIEYRKGEQSAIEVDFLLRGGCRGVNIDDMIWFESLFSVSKRYCQSATVNGGKEWFQANVSASKDDSTVFRPETLCGGKRLMKRLLNFESRSMSFL